MRSEPGRFYCHIIAPYDVSACANANGELPFAAELLEPASPNAIQSFRGETKSFFTRPRNFLCGKEPAQADQQGVRHFCLRHAWKTRLRSAVFSTPIKESSRAGHEDILDGQGGIRFVIHDIRAALFPEQIAFISIQIQLPGEDLEDGKMVRAAKLLTSALTNNIMRLINPDEAKGQIIQCINPANDDDNDEDPHVVSRVLRGEDVYWVDLINGMVKSHARFLAGDRIPSLSLLLSHVEALDAFSYQDLQDLSRIAHGFSDFYLPEVADGSPDTHPQRIFQNVVCATAAEGAAYWVRALPTQRFLSTQTPTRFASVQYLLFLLALFQRYALTNAADRLTSEAHKLVEHPAFPSASEHAKPEDHADIAKLLWTIQVEMVNFRLQYVFKQPSAVSNHMHFYNMLRQAFSVDELAGILNTSATQIGQLAENLYERHQTISNDAANHKLLITLTKLQQHSHRRERWMWMIAFCAELFAVPYYALHTLESVLVPLLKLYWPNSCSIFYSEAFPVWGAACITAAVFGVTLLLYYRTYHEKPV